MAARACRSGKRRFKDRLAALMALADAGQSTKSVREESRAYRCPACRGWHLTSKAAYVTPKLGNWQTRQRYEPPGIRGLAGTKRD